MSALVLVLYVGLGIAVVALVPGISVIGREALRRRHERRAVERLAAARKVLSRLRVEPAARVARSLAQGFDRSTILAVLEQALDEEARCAVVCEELGLRAAWERALRESKSWNERAHAARMLGKLGAASASPALASALANPHEDTTVRLAAAEAIGSIPDIAVLPHLCEALASQGEGGAKVVAEALISFGSDAVRPLVEMLDDERVQARTWAARVLGKIGDPGATLSLVAQLGDGNAAARTAAAEALGHIGDPRSTRPLVSVVLGDPSSGVRARAAAALARVGDEEVVGTLVATLGDPDPEVRSRAVDALAALSPKDRSAIERALFDPCDDVRRSAALAMDRLGMVSAWAAALGEATGEGRAAARAALVAVGRAGLSEAIVAAARHEAGAVRAGVFRILGELGSSRHAAALGRALDDAAAEARESAALALGRIGGEQAVAMLGRDKPEGVAQAVWIVARALAGVETWVAEARALLSDPVAAAAARAVCEAEGEAVARAFEARVGTVRPAESGRRMVTLSRFAIAARRAARLEDRVRAILELADRRGPEATAALAEVAVSDPSAEARALAARSLAQVEERWLAVPALVRALSDPSPEVVFEASQALGLGAGGEDKKGRRSSEGAPSERNGASRRTTGSLFLEKAGETAA
ncbi:HEAT repeat domain-containing protein [Polyangium sorediatum]|uniref:HEAT repeat domain-containing protein n=1 Tax=Polyangium sorediatum TaxID=889274 RepID=A0ABT6P4R4_9BACT|nr:HEAT repeat domain-containing protein [Polyangium sorediatum]MDI1435610.1 HEAT repeat domain-containing protein [Polyangium sorediatum]